MRRLCLAAAFGCLVAAACGSPTTPSSGQTLNLAGAWSGTMSDSSGGPGPVSLILQQNGSSLTGTMAADGFGGSVTGTISGTTVRLSATVPRGAVIGEPTCSITTTGTAVDVTASVMNGTYSGVNSCNGPFTNGRFSLTKRP